MKPGCRPLRCLLIALAGIVLSWASAAWGVDELVVELDGINAAGWSTGPLNLRIGTRAAQGLRFELDARRLQLPPPLDNLKRIRVKCAEGRWSDGHIRCDRAEITPTLGARQGPPLTLILDYAQDSGRLRLSGRDLTIAGARLDLDVTLGADGGRGKLHALGLGIPQLKTLAAGLNPDWPLVDIEIAAGRADLNVEFDLATTDAGTDGQFAAQLKLRELDFSDSPGLHAGEDVEMTLAVQANSHNGRWKFTAESAFRKGTLYLDPLLLEAAAGKPVFTAQGAWRPGRSLDVARFSFRHPGVVHFSGSGQWLEDPSPHLAALQVVLPPAPLEPLYAHYLQAYTGAGALSELAIEGRLGLVLDWRAGADSLLDIQVRDLAIGDTSGLIALIGLKGDLHWRSGAPGPASQLTWSNAQLYRLDLGAGSIDLRFQDRSLELLAPLRVELLAGALEVPSLKVIDLGLADMQLEMALELDGIDLGELGNTLAWVPLSGELSGRIPALSFSHGRLEIAGAIELSLFDGQARISNLSLDDPFGLVPRLGADIDLQNLSLDLLSRSFSFGAIEGRLDGQIQNLVLDGWQPVSFDARFQTPPGDTSRHRISQRAVDNLASLGGANAVLSSTFLRFFKEFSYRQLGLSCRLQAGVCAMDGVAPADPGYYIIQGGGIPPRVDVVGYNRRVDWQILLERLRAINQLDEVVVQ